MSNAKGSRQVTRGGGRRLNPSEGWPGPDFLPSRRSSPTAIVAILGAEPLSGRASGVAMAPREARIESEAGIVCEQGVVADSFGLRLRGLLGRRGLEPNEGLLLVGSPSLHTTFMRFPIDAVFLDRELVVIGIRPNMRPWRLAGRRRAKHVLELRAGETDRRAVGAGTRLRLIEPASAPNRARPETDPDVRSAIRVMLGASDRRFL